MATAHEIRDLITQTTTGSVRPGVPSAARFAPDRHRRWTRSPVGELSLEQESEVDFSKPPRGMATPYFPAKHAAPEEDDVPAGAEWFPWDLTIGPADGGGGRSAPNPMSIIGPGAAMPSLAEMLNWRVPDDRKQ
jgi:hypothetical protein